MTIQLVATVVFVAILAIVVLDVLGTLIDKRKERNSVTNTHRYCGLCGAVMQFENVPLNERYAVYWLCSNPGGQEGHDRYLVRWGSRNPHFDRRTGEKIGR